MHTPSGIEALAPYTDELSDLLARLAEANSVAVDKAKPKTALHARFWAVVKDVVHLSFQSTIQRQRLGGLWALGWLAVCGAIAWQFFKRPEASWLSGAVLPLLVTTIFFYVAPSALFGWVHLIPALRRHLRFGGAAAVKQATPEVLVAQADDPVTKKLVCIRISGGGIKRDLLSHQTNVTTTETPSTYVLYRKVDGSPLHLVNAGNGQYCTWTSGNPMLEQNYTQYAEDLLAELRREELLDVLQELATVVGAERLDERANESAVFKPVAPPVVTSVAASWDDLILNEGFKEELQQDVEMLKNSKELRKRGFNPPAALLLYGPPGTGKTQVARTLAAASGLSFVSKSASDLKGQFIGQSAPLVAAAFQAARKASPAILFIDEIESVASRRDASYGDRDRLSDEIVAALLVEMDGVVKQAGEVFVVAATNFPEKIDTAILSRFGAQREIALPDRVARERMLEVFLKSKPLSGDLRPTLRKIAEQTDGCSGRDLRTMVERAARSAIARALNSGNMDRAQITAEDLLSASR